jgi:histidinol-phosphate aminotransferase
MSAPDRRLRFNKHFEGLPAYNAGMSLNEASRLSGGRQLARLASNENPYKCSPAAIAALQQTTFEPWRYSESDSASLRRALSAKMNVAQECIVTGNGSEALIAAICHAFLEPGDGVVTVVPSFGLHEIEPMAKGAAVTKIPMTAELEFDVEAIEAALDYGPRVVFISSPSNPVGTTLSQSDFARLLQAVRPGSLLVLDEAYIEFQEPAGVFDSLAMAKTSGVDFVTLRTFSKAYGLAGLRIGYGLASSVVIADLMRSALTPFNVNTAAQKAAIASLADQSWMIETTRTIARSRDEFDYALRQRGFVPARSEGNFLFFDTGFDAAEVSNLLLVQGIIVKPWREDGFETFIRVSIGLPSEMDAFLLAFDSVCDASDLRPI